MEEKKSIKEDARVTRTKRDLANALEKLLVLKYYEDISVKDITDEALISKNTFYNNFKDKDDLMIFLCERYKEQIIAGVKPIISTRYTPGIKKIYAKKAIEILVDSFFNIVPQFAKIIEHDKAHSLFYIIVSFIRDSLDELQENYPHFFTKKIPSKVTSSSLAGSITTIFYFCFNQDEIMDKTSIVNIMYKICSPFFD